MPRKGSMVTASRWVKLVSRSSSSASSAGISDRMPSSRSASRRMSTVEASRKTKLNANSAKVSHALTSPAITASRRVSWDSSQPSR